MPQYRPSAPELLTALAELLEDTLLPELPEGLRHSARVGANVARILRREWEALPPERTIAAAPDEIGDAELDPISWQALVDVVRRDLAVAKPGYDLWERE
ncbi:hypothetical protein APR11_000214 [Nocardia amikacinitolerans]|uniref:hypothetical protein n=1 Tax=Nocardia amikacinitolerans TaxID=756689 RepID=UPI0020A48F17|nr:hypothetical protein [Nocardia amikacinitolerans]MCP2293810.1 hypothetical protein [Nocardia amikacinitolerans]